MTRLSPLSQALLHSRRTFLLRGGSTLAFPLALVGCGGGGGGDDDNGAPSGSGSGTSTSIVALTQSSAKGTIVLPAGATVTIASVGNAFAVNTPAADGSFDLVSAAESEMFAVAVGPGGKMVLCGLLQAGSTIYSTQLSARSTAMCLAYTVLGVGVYLPSTQEQYLAAIQASPSLSVLETAVAAAIVARGEGWLDLTDAVLKSALAAMQVALSPTALSSSAGMASRAQIQSVTAPGSEGRVKPQGTVIDKTARTSGIQVTGDGVGTITLTNYYRRRSYAYIERVSYQDTYTGAVTDSPATVGMQPMKIDATKSVTNSLVTLAQLYAGVKDFYDPVVYDSIPTPIAPASAALTTYRVTSVGLGVTPGDLSLLTADQRTGLRNVCAETVVLDVIVPIFCGILIPLKAAPIKAFTDTIALSNLKDVISALAASDDILLNKIVAANRPLNEILWDTLITIVNSERLKNSILAFFQGVIDSIPVQGVLPASTDVVNIGAKSLLDALAAIDLTAQAMDLVITGLSYAFSDLADRFTIDVTKSQVRLNPSSTQIDPAVLTQTNLTLSVIDSDLTSDDLSYRWSCPCLFGDISDKVNSSPANGTAFDSSFPNLAYAPKGQGKGGDKETVTGTVYKGHILTTRVPIGTATSTITYNTVISPATPQVLFNTDQTFSADISSTLLQSGRALQYVWTVTGGHGSVGGAATTTTTTPSVVYRAGKESIGVDSLDLSVIDAGGGVYTTGTVALAVISNITIALSPVNPQVAPGTNQTFTATTTGTVPDGASYVWNLNGAGLLSGTGEPTSSGTYVTTTPTIRYTATSTAEDKITVNVVDVAGNLLAKASMSINFTSIWVGTYIGTENFFVCEPSSFGSVATKVVIKQLNPNSIEARMSVIGGPSDGYEEQGSYVYVIDGTNVARYGSPDGVVFYQNLTLTLNGDTLSYEDLAYPDPRGPCNTGTFVRQH